MTGYSANDDGDEEPNWFRRTDHDDIISTMKHSSIKNSVGDCVPVGLISNRAVEQVSF